MQHSTILERVAEFLGTDMRVCVCVCVCVFACGVKSCNGELVFYAGAGKLEMSTTCQQGLTRYSSWFLSTLHLMGWSHAKFT